MAVEMTMIAALQPYYFELFVPRDSVDDLKPSLGRLDPVEVFLLCDTAVLLYCMVFYTLEFFNFFNWWQWLLVRGRQYRDHAGAYLYL